MQYSILLFVSQYWPCERHRAKEHSIYSNRATQRETCLCRINRERRGGAAHSSAVHSSYYHSVVSEQKGEDEESRPEQRGGTTYTSALPTPPTLCINVVDFGVL